MKKLLTTVVAMLLPILASADNEEQEFYPRRIVMEEATGTWCGWCVRGIETIERMKKEYPDNFIGIAIHSGDEMANHENYDFLISKVSGYPGCFINRSTSNSTSVDYSFAKRDVLKYKDKGIAKIESKAAFTDGTYQSVSVSSETIFGFSSSSSSYKIAYVVVEDGVGPYSQYNYYSGNSNYNDPNDYMYQWFLKSSPVDVVFNDVARGIYENEDANSKNFPDQIQKGTSYKNEFTFKLPSNIENAKKIRIIALLIDKATEEIVNASQSNITNSDGSEVEEDVFYSRRTVMEEATGTWCGWCVRGIETIERMKKEYPDNFIAIALHAGDEMSNLENYDFLTDNVNGYPGCFFNRNTSSTVSVSYNSAKNEVTKYKDKGIAKIESNATFANANKTSVSVSTETEFGFSSSSSSYKIAYVVVEDGVGPYSQSNYYSGNSNYNDPNNYMYDWYLKPSPVDVVFNDVARGIYEDEASGSKNFPDKIQKETPYKNSFTFQLPSNINNIANIRIIALLIDVQTGEIMNASQSVVTEGQGLEGDVNGDGKVNVADIVAIIKIIAAGGYDEKADVNHDNKVSEEDVLVVTKIIFN